MHRTTLLWIALGTTYLAFFSWYTSFGGPLTETEIEAYLQRFAEQATDATPERLAQLRAFMENDSGDDFVMINAIDLYDQPQRVPGVEAGDSSSDVLNKYMEFMYPALFSRASHPVLFGQAASNTMDLMNAPGMHRWTQGAAMRYRSRRDMLDIATNPQFSGAHEFKIAAMAKTIAFPIDPWWQLGDPRVVLALVLTVIGSLVSWRAAVKRSD